MILPCNVKQGQVSAQSCGKEHGRIASHEKRAPGKVPEPGPFKGRRTFIATQHIYINTHVDIGIYAGPSRRGNVVYQIPKPVT